MYTSPQVLTIMFWTGSKVSWSLIHLHPGGRWLMVNLGNVIPDEVFAVLKGVIPHCQKDGPSFLIFFKLGYHPICVKDSGFSPNPYSSHFLFCSIYSSYLSFMHAF